MSRYDAAWETIKGLENPHNREMDRGMDERRRQGRVVFEGAVCVNDDPPPEAHSALHITGKETGQKRRKSEEWSGTVHEEKCSCKRTKGSVRERHNMGVGNGVFKDVKNASNRRTRRRKRCRRKVTMGVTKMSWVTVKIDEIISKY